MFDEADRTMRLAIRLLVVFAFLMGIITAIIAVAVWMNLAPAHAHSWYDHTCCDVTDCKPLPPDAVRIAPDGYHLPNGQVVPFSRARISMDRDYHWCRRTENSPLIEPYGELACFYAPHGGM